MRCGIYGIHNKITDKWYIGQSQDIEKRWAAHRWGLSHGKGESVHLLRAWRKYGATAFEWVVLEKCRVEELDAKEIAWIKKKDSIRNGYNQTSGGGGMRGYQQSEETRQRRSASLSKAMQSASYRKLRASLSKEMWENEEYREKVLRSRAASMATAEYKQKISKTSKERYSNPAYRKNYQEKIRAYYNDPQNHASIVERNRKTAADEERNKKIGIAHAERYANNPELREKVSADSTARWADSEYKERVTATLKESAQERAVQVLQVEEGIVYPSMEEASIAMGGKNKSGVCNCCKGKQIMACGYHWRYADDTAENWEERRQQYLSQLNASRRHGHVPVPVYCFNNKKTYNSCKEAAEDLGLNPSSISKVCRGKCRATKDFCFKYVEETDEKDGQ